MTIQLENLKPFEPIPFFPKEMMEISDRPSVSDETIQKLLGSVCHDLRSPFTSILGFIEILKEGDEINNLNEILPCLERTAQRGMELTNELLEFMSFGLNRKPLYFESCHFSELFQESITEIKPLADKKKIHIIQDFKSYQKVRVDRQSIIRVLNNLLTNAIKFSSPASSVTCYTNSQKLGLYVEVSDFGVGIGKDRIPGLFDWHCRDFTTGTEGEVGHGWGLSLCQQIIMAHGSEIKVQSLLNRGSRFYFLLPWDDSALVA